MGDTYQAAVARQMSEEALDIAVRRLLAHYGLQMSFIHLPDGTGGYTPGVPDFAIVGPAGILWRELKTQAGRLSPEQRFWIERLERHGCDVTVWRPADLLSGRINSELARIAGTPQEQADGRRHYAAYQEKRGRRKPRPGRRVRRAA